jgi:glutamyl/glutaminyl-tRNA synthetase
MTIDDKVKPCLKTRIAPTPSGYLHLGNIYNFLLIKLIADVSQGQIHLRIDDHDPDRFRIEYVEDIFEQLNWLQIQWHSGPVDVRDFMSNYRSMDKLVHYKNYFLEFQTEAFNRLYVCQCSRSQLEQLSANPCRHLKLNYEKDLTTIRYYCDQNQIDTVIWRKDDLPSYHWMSLCEDVDHEINFIVRGEDLKESSLVQKDIAQNFSRFHSFVNCQIYHHSLVKTNNNEKLSKSQKASPIYLARQAGLTRDVLLSQFSQWMGFKASTDWDNICQQYLPRLSTLSTF